MNKDERETPFGYVVWLDDEWGCWCFGLAEDGLSINKDPIESEDRALADAWEHAGKNTQVEVKQ